MKIKALNCLFLILLATSCDRSTPSNNEHSGSAAAKRYHLKGKVVSIDKQSKMANVDSEAIPGFMDAMTMPYTLKPASEVDQLKPGDTITADVVLQDENAWLENINVVSHGPAAK